MMYLVMIMCWGSMQHCQMGVFLHGLLKLQCDGLVL
jgi:hypothetical protein